MVGVGLGVRFDEADGARYSRRLRANRRMQGEMLEEKRAMNHPKLEDAISSSISISSISSSSSSSSGLSNRPHMSIQRHLLEEVPPKLEAPGYEGGNILSRSANPLVSEEVEVTTIDAFVEILRLNVGNILKLDNPQTFKNDKNREAYAYANANKNGNENKDIWNDRPSHVDILKIDAEGYVIRTYVDFDV